MKKILAALLFVVLFLSACGPEPVAVVSVEPMAESVVEPVEVVVIPELPKSVGEKGTLSITRTEVEVEQGECVPNVVELTLSNSDLKFNFLPTDPKNPLSGISPCNGDLQYGTGTGSGTFGVHAPVSMVPGIYNINIVVEVSIDYYYPDETLSVPLTVKVVEKKE